MCGPANGNNNCLSGLCCSAVGYAISPSLSVQPILTFQVIVVIQRTIARPDVNLLMEIALQTLVAMELEHADRHLVMPNARRENVAHLRYASICASLNRSHD